MISYNSDDLIQAMCGIVSISYGIVEKIPEL